MGLYALFALFAARRFVNHTRLAAHTAISNSGIVDVFVLVDVDVSVNVDVIVDVIVSVNVDVIVDVFVFVIVFELVNVNEWVLSPTDRASSAPSIRIRAGGGMSIGPGGRTLIWAMLSAPSTMIRRVGCARVAVSGSVRAAARLLSASDTSIPRVNGSTGAGPWAWADGA